MAEDEMLLPLQSEQEDSGIDSDEEQPENVQDPELQYPDGYSSEDDANQNNVYEPMLPHNDDFERLKMMSLHKEQYLFEQPRSLDRCSPQLYEVELTASDEDEDGSVLELVIPLQGRYKRNQEQESMWYWLNALFCMGWFQ